MASKLLRLAMEMRDRRAKWNRASITLTRNPGQPQAIKAEHAAWVAFAEARDAFTALMRERPKKD